MRFCSWGLLSTNPSQGGERTSACNGEVNKGRTGRMVSDTKTLELERLSFSVSLSVSDTNYFSPNFSSHLVLDSVACPYSEADTQQH